MNPDGMNAGGFSKSGDDPVGKVFLALPKRGGLAVEKMSLDASDNLNGKQPPQSDVSDTVVVARRGLFVLRS